MLATLLAWIVLAFALFTFGEMLLALYNKLCHREEQYNPIDKVLLGLCALIIPLSLWSLWLPSNQLFLAIVLFICICYWTINVKRAGKIFSKIRNTSIKDVPLFEIVIWTAFTLSSLFFFSWIQDIYDSAFYHMQNIRWNEEFAVVPGLANLDDKLGFNSNYLLLSAVFSFRFILGEALFPLHSLIITLCGGWILYELFKSKYEIKRILIFASFLLLYWVSVYFLQNTSTDILPNFVVFYIFTRILLYPDLLKNNILIGIILPVFLVTCKLSFLPICFISLYLIYTLIKKKEYKPVISTLIICLLIFIPWLIRNVIVSGYLIYPLYQVDLFDFDWKVPVDIAIRQKDYISSVGYYFLRIALKYPGESIRDTWTINILTDIIYILAFASIITTAYYIVKNKKDSSNIPLNLLFCSSVAALAIWFFGGPDIRFVSGILCSVILIGSTILLRGKERQFRLFGKLSICLFIIGIVLWTGSRYTFFAPQVVNKNIYPLSQQMIKPFTIKDQAVAKGIDMPGGFWKQPINNGLSISVSYGLPYDIFLPATVDYHYAKFLPLNCIEARGNTIQEGYRAKSGC